MQQKKRLTQTEAENYLGVSRPKMLKLIEQGQLTFEKDTLDNRKKWFKLSDLRKLKEVSR